MECNFFCKYSVMPLEDFILICIEDFNFTNREGDRFSTGVDSETIFISLVPEIEPKELS
jgi:hypothetical protein